MSDEEQLVADAPGQIRSDDDDEDNNNNNNNDDDDDHAQPPPEKQKYKSWRKKYRKMKAHFDEVLKENNASFVEEQKLHALNKRLQEQNDQLLEILLDLNNSLKIPKSLRYDLSTSHSTLDIDADVDVDMNMDIPTANAEIAAYRAAVQQGECPPATYTAYRSKLEASLSAKAARKLADLEAIVPHPMPLTETGDVDVALHPEYLSTAATEIYLAALDAKSGSGHSLTAPPPAAPKFGDMTPRELEREIEMRNHHSVHNWLKRYAKENSGNGVGDDASEAGAVATPATNRKRNNNLAKKMGDKAVDRARGAGDKGDKTSRDEGSPASVRTVGTEGEADDEDGGDAVAANTTTTTTASARKKGGDKDDTYRPKGGRSAKAKRKREGGEEGTPTAKGKKARTSLAASAAAAAAAAATAGDV